MGEGEDESGGEEGCRKKENEGGDDGLLLGPDGEGPREEGEGGEKVRREGQVGGEILPLGAKPPRTAVFEYVCTRSLFAVASRPCFAATRSSLGGAGALPPVVPPTLVVGGDTA